MSEQTWGIGRMEVISPYGNAGGVVKTPGELERMVRVGVGWSEAGSYTVEKRYGNKRDENGEFIIDPETNEPLVDYYHDPQTGETGNSLGMPQMGLDELVPEIPGMIRTAARFGKEVVFNVAPVSSEPIAETHELVLRTADAGARRILVNGGCPNVPILGAEAEARKELLSRNANMTYRVLHGLKPVVMRYPDLDIYFRPSPMETYDQAKIVYRNVERAGTVRAAWVCNTWPGYKPMKDDQPALTIRGNIGGKSGPAMADPVERQIRWAIDILRGTGIDVVASSAIANSEPLGLRAAEQLKRYMDLGAVAGAGTTFYYEIEDGWEEDTDRMLHEFLDLAA